MDWTDDYNKLMALDRDGLAPSDYRDALMAQSACNLSGLVTSLARATQKIWVEARAGKFGTEWVNKHPVCRLYAEQIMHLTGIQQGFVVGDNYSEAYEFCEKRAMETVKAGEKPPWKSG